VIVQEMTVLPFWQPEIQGRESRLHGYRALLSRCSIGGFDLATYRQRPKDAYGALWYLLHGHINPVVPAVPVTAPVASFQQET